MADGGRDEGEKADSCLLSWLCIVHVTYLLLTLLSIYPTICLSACLAACLTPLVRLMFRHFVSLPIIYAA